MNLQHTKKQQAGVVILEALIAILIFSMGVLALVGMQATAINNVADAKYRSTAGFLAQQMIGTVWASRQNSVTANASNVMVANVDPTFACNPCTAANGNAYTQAWAARVSAELANASGANAPSIAINGTAVTVTIKWQPPKDAVTHQHVVSAYID